MKTKSEPTAINIDVLYSSHDPYFYGEMLDEVFTSFIGSSHCEKLNRTEKRAVMKLYAELDRFFNEETIRVTNEESERRDGILKAAV